MTDARHDILNTDTVLMERLPPAAPALDPAFSQWTHYNPILVEALAAHGNVPEQEVVDHLSLLFDEVYEGKIPGVRPLERPAWVLRTYLEDHVAVG
jgi:hypothetical protein